MKTSFTMAALAALLSGVSVAALAQQPKVNAGCLSKGATGFNFGLIRLNSKIPPARAP